MSSKTVTRKDVSGKTTEYARGKQGRPKMFDKKYGQRLFSGDSDRIKAMGYSKTDFVRLATHKFLNDLENNGYTELVNT